MDDVLPSAWEEVRTFLIFLVTLLIRSWPSWITITYYLIIYCRTKKMNYPTSMGNLMMPLRTFITKIISKLYKFKIESFVSTYLYSYLKRVLIIPIYILLKSFVFKQTGYRPVFHNAMIVHSDRGFYILIIRNLESIVFINVVYWVQRTIS